MGCSLFVMAVCRVMRSGVLLLLVFVFTRDLSISKCLTPLVNHEVNSSGLAVGQEVSSFVGFKQPVRKKTSNGRHFGFSLTPVAKVQLVRLTRSVFLASLLLQCNDISVNPEPSTKITCPRCLKTVRRNQAFGFCVLCKSRFHLKCLDANFESSSTCHFCSVPSSAEQQFDGSLNDSFVVPATSDATLKFRGLKFVHQNIRSLRKKLNELRVFLTQSPRIHIIALTETWLNSNISDAEVSLPGFTLFRRDRLVRKGGGVAVYVSD